MSIVFHEGDLLVNKPAISLEPERDTYSWIWKFDLVAWVFQRRVVDTDIAAQIAGYRVVQQDENGIAYRKREDRG